VTNTTNRNAEARCTDNIRALLKATYAAEPFFDLVAPLALAAAIELVTTGEVTAEAMAQVLRDMTEAD
jgi:hypothetical protein